MEPTDALFMIIVNIVLFIIFAIVMNNAYVGSIFFPFKTNPVSCPDKFLREL